MHEDVAHPAHAAIVDQHVWHKAHAVMAEPAHRRGAATRAQVPALLKGLIFGPNGRPMSPSHTRRRGRIYRYYVTREAIANGYDTCTEPVGRPGEGAEYSLLPYLRALLEDGKIGSEDALALNRLADPAEFFACNMLAAQDRERPDTVDH